MPKITAKNFKRMLSGDKAYLPAKVQKELKSAGLSPLLYEKEVTKDQAMKVAKYLKDKGLATIDPSKSVDSALSRDKADIAAVEKKRLGHVRLMIQEDIAAEKLAGFKEEYSKHSVLGKALADDLTQEHDKRDSRFVSEKTKRESLIKSVNGQDKGQKVDLPDMAKLNDMDIG